MGSVVATVKTAAAAANPEIFIFIMSEREMSCPKRHNNGEMKNERKRLKDLLIAEGRRRLLWSDGGQLYILCFTAQPLQRTDGDDDGKYWLGKAYASRVSVYHLASCDGLFAAIG